jgi:hypothetical protein
MINIKLYKWFEKLDFDYKQNIIEILKYLSVNKFVSDRDMFSLSGMKLKYIEKAWRNDVILKYWSATNNTLFYSIAVDGHYILNKIGTNTVMSLNTPLSQFEDIYNKQHKEKLLLDDLVVVKLNDIQILYEISEAFLKIRNQNIIK